MKKKLLFSFITLVFFLLLVEVTFRIIFWTKYKKYNTSLAVQGNSLQMDDDVLVFRNRPYYLDGNKGFQFNEEGFKSEAGDVKMPVKSNGEFWVFLFGASAMEGMGSNKDGEWLDITGVRDHSYTESVAFLLQKKLQSNIKNRKVRVFCAANSGFCVYQSMLQYQRLRMKYKMDWVISLDGANEQIIDDPDSSVRDHIESGWDNYPIFKFPLKYIIPITKRSAFVNSLKQALFEVKMKARLKKAIKNDFPAKKKWLSFNAGQINYDTSSLVVKRSVDTFFYYMKTFDSVLKKDDVPHLLFVQPHLIMRDTSVASPTEKALLNYYEFTRGPMRAFNSFILEIHETAEREKYDSIRTLSFMHKNKFETFVDYCHFTNRAIDQLAEFFSVCITSQYYSTKKSQ